MAMTGLLYNQVVPVADGIEFRVHTLEEIFEFGEQQYYEDISLFLATPWDYMWSLHESGIDYEDITNFELFLGLVTNFTEEDARFLFGDTLPLHRMKPAQNVETNEIVLIDPEDQEVQFNARSLTVLAALIRKIHYIQYERHIAGNKEAKAYFLERARKKARRAKRKQRYESTLEPLIISLVNAPEFPYNYETCKNVTIYQFMASLAKIPQRLSWNFVMHGVHVGMIDSKNIDWDKLNWLT